ncbi:MAG: hypothetical protein R2855_16295 [Thermomicrobiales bacterium]
MNTGAWANPDFWFVKNTVIFTIGAAMIGQTIGGLLIALLIHHARIHKHKLAGGVHRGLARLDSPANPGGLIWGGIFDDATMNTVLTDASSAARIDTCWATTRCWLSSWSSRGAGLRSRSSSQGLVNDSRPGLREVASIDGATPRMHHSDAPGALWHVISLVFAGDDDRSPSAAS